MSENNKKGFWNSIKKQIDEFMDGAPKDKIMYTADNAELDFYELSEDAVPTAKNGDTAGDKARYDGKPAGDSNGGEYVMASGDTYKFVGNELVEIIPKAEDNNEDLQAENQKLTEEVQNLRTQVTTLTNSNKDKDGKITTLNSQLLQAKTIITNFKNLGGSFDEDEEEEKRGPKPKEENGRSRVSNALSKLKKEN